MTPPHRLHPLQLQIVQLTVVPLITPKAMLSTPSQQQSDPLLMDLQPCPVRLLQPALLRPAKQQLQALPLLTKLLPATHRFSTSSRLQGLLSMAFLTHRQVQIQHALQHVGDYIGIVLGRTLQGLSM